jgi:phosphatidylglycerophosphate synthase
MNPDLSSAARELEPIRDVQSHQVINTSALARLERPILYWLVAHMPAWVTPDHLTALGFLGALIIFAGYILTEISPAYLWLASFGYVLNWLGDALDGALARFRAIERPAYGFFVDHAVDAINATFAFLGMGLSPYVRFDVGALVLVTFLMMSLLITLQYSVNGTYRLSYGPMGPTEIRLTAVLANTLAFFLGVNHFRWFGVTLTLFDLLCLALTGLGYAVFITAMFQQARELNEREQSRNRVNSVK